MPTSRHRLPLATCTCLLVVSALPLAGTGNAAEPVGPWRVSTGASYSAAGDTAAFFAFHKPLSSWREYQIEVSLGGFGKHADTDNPINRRSVGFAALGAARQFGDWTLSFSLAAVHQRTEALSSNGQFLTQVRYRMTARCEMLFGHMSNASLRGPNRGETFLALSVDL